MYRDHFKQCERVAEQVRRVCELYSRIGEPLPADTIIDLHRHLAPALEAVAPAKKNKRRPIRGAEA